MCFVSTYQQLMAVLHALQDIYANFTYGEDHPYYPGKKVILNIKQFYVVPRLWAAYRAVEKLCWDKIVKKSS